jgi:hypothetical protein
MKKELKLKETFDKYCLPLLKEFFEEKVTILIVGRIIVTNINGKIESFLFK